MISLTELISLDNKKEQIRSDAKTEMRRIANEYSSEAKIVFPKSHLKPSLKQLRFGLPWIYNGFLLYLPGLVMAIDPGPDFMFRLGLSGIDISAINTIFVSHGHLDHVAGVNTLSDWLIRSHQNTEIIAPVEVFEEREISSYHAGYKMHHSGWKNAHFATPLTTHMESFALNHGGYTLIPLQMFHSAPCYGFSVSYKKQKISYISDTGYSLKIKTTEGIVDLAKDQIKGSFVSHKETRSEVKNAVRDTTTLIVNVESLQYEKNSYTHLTLFDVIDIIKGSNIKTVVIAHCNPVGELLYGEWAAKLAKYLQQETGIFTVAPKASGLALNL